MKWGEAKMICLQTMFANEGPALTESDSNRDYLYAMPGKANEAMMQLSMVGRPLLKEAKIAVGWKTSWRRRCWRAAIPAACT